MKVRCEEEKEIARKKGRGRIGSLFSEEISGSVREYEGSLLDLGVVIWECIFDKVIQP